MADSVINPRWSIAPYFVVDDVVTTANYYRDKLGFKYERFWGEPPCFCMVHRSGIVIMLGQLEVMASCALTELSIRKGEPGTPTSGSITWMHSMWSSNPRA